MDKVEAIDMLEAKLKQSEINEAAAVLAAKKAQFQLWLNELWKKYGKTDSDRLEDDGSWGKVTK